MSSPKLLLAFIALITFGAFHAEGAAAQVRWCLAGEPSTLSEQFRSEPVVVLAKLVNRPDVPANAQACECTFDVFNVIKGARHIESLRTPGGKLLINTDYWGDAPLESNMLISGYYDANEPAQQADVRPADLKRAPAKVLLWVPTPVSETAVDYISSLPLLPEYGAERLAFFLPYLDERDDFVHSDARREFEAVPFAELKKLKPLLKREDQLAKIGNFRIDSARQKLALRLLAVCGTHDDVAFLESLMRNTDQKVAASRTAQIECYLALRGEAGMSLVEQRFLSDPKADYADTYGALLALGYTWDETRAVPRERLLAAMRLLLDRPDVADLVVPHLTKRQDWSVVDRLVTLFEQADPKENWVRLPVAIYLRTCPLPEAKVHLARLAEIDPEVMRRAETYYPIQTSDAP